MWKVSEIKGPSRLVLCFNQIDSFIYYTVTHTVGRWFFLVGIATEQLSVYRQSVSDLVASESK